MTAKNLTANTQNSLKRWLTGLAQTARTSKLDRIICASCLGYGGDEEGLKCASCNNQGFCAWHICKTCQGRGVVCPRCKGMRFLRSGTPGHLVKSGGSYSFRNEDSGKTHTAHSMQNSAIGRCEMCCEGNQVNPIKEFAAIKAYIASPDTGEWKLRAKAQALQEAEETRSRFLSRFMRGHRKRWYGRGKEAEETIRQEALDAWEREGA